MKNRNSSKKRSLITTLFNSRVTGPGFIGLGKFEVSNNSRNRSISPVRGNDDPKAEGFFLQIIKDLRDQYKLIEHSPANNEKPAFILVCHMAPTLYPYLIALSQIGRIALIIPKGWHRANAKKVEQSLKEGKYKCFYDVLMKRHNNETDQDFYKNEIITKGTQIICDCVKEKEEFIIIDIGGYFSNFYEKFSFNNDILGGNRKLLGIVEDTENGQQKYEKARLNLKEKNKTNSVPIYSVARSDLKNTEDYNVGKSIVEATSTILRVHSHTMLERMEIIGVIGFGKIGRSIAEHLRQKNLKEIVIYDTDIIRQMEASSLGFKTTSRPYLIMNSAFIFCATGKKSLKAEDFDYFLDNVFIASCTSREDELDFSFLKYLTRSEELEESTNINKMIISGKRINLLDNGNAVNFVHGAVNGPYIYSVQAGLMTSAFKIIINKGNNVNFESKLIEKDKLEKLERIEMDQIAMLWQHCFDKLDTKIDIHTEKLIVTYKEIKNNSINEPKVYFESLFKYLEVNGYLLQHQQLNQLIQDIFNVVNNFNQHKYKLTNILDSIHQNISSYKFYHLMGYLSDFLIDHFCITNEFQTHYRRNSNVIKLKLYILKAFAESLVDFSAKNEWIRTKTFKSLDTELLTLQAKGEKLSPKAKEYFDSFYIVYDSLLSKKENSFVEIAIRIRKVYNELNIEERNSPNLSLN